MAIDLMFKNFFKKIFKPKNITFNQVSCMCQCQGGVLLLNEWGDLYSIMPDSNYGWKIELVSRNMNRR
jgi:hypothetical protein